MHKGLAHERQRRDGFTVLLHRRMQRSAAAGVKQEEVAPAGSECDGINFLFNVRDPNQHRW